MDYLPRDMSFPRFALAGQRQTLRPEPVALPVVFGTRPSQLLGSWEVVAADGGFADARTLERRAFPPFLNGEGFVSGLRFGPDGVFALRRPVETLCFIADREAEVRGASGSRARPRCSACATRRRRRSRRSALKVAARRAHSSRRVPA